MKELTGETELKLSKSQLQNVINDHVQKENGLNDLFSLLVNGLMVSERRTFLSEDQTKNILKKSSITFHRVNIKRLPFQFY